jgi:hydroxymethylglutaryl-CoA lyase
MQDLCAKTEKELVVYLSMGFGNPYGDHWSEEIVYEWAAALSEAGRTDAVAGGHGRSGYTRAGLFRNSITWSGSCPVIPSAYICIRLHHNRKAKIDAALQAGCRRFDGALKGIGGCPMAGDDLVGNMDTEWMIDYFRQQQLLPPLDEEALQEADRLAAEIFS